MLLRAPLTFHLSDGLDNNSYASMRVTESLTRQTHNSLDFGDLSNIDRLQFPKAGQMN